MQYVLGNAKQPADLGKHFGANLYEAEVRYLIHNEWAQTAADIVWRRSKVGLHMTPDQTTALDVWLSELDA
jgi:glycerol-3-phosphate dehydrogenase